MRHFLLLSALTCVAVAHAEELPRPDYANSFCLFPIEEHWHVGNAAQRAERSKTIEEMRRVIGPERLYARLGIAIISEGAETQTYQLAQDLGIGLVLQGGAIEHHSSGWLGKLLSDPAQADRRFVQWFQDGSFAEPLKDGDASFNQRACASRYAAPVYELRRQVDTARAARVARAMKQFPETVVACSGPIECEMHNSATRWGDYSPFTVAEFRDYLTHRGIYAPGAERAKLGYPGGEIWRDDVSPAQANGAHQSFNTFFGTNFSSWNLRYWDIEKFAERLPFEASGMPQAGERGFIAGGFDAPRVWPGVKSDLTSEGNDKYWDAWASVDDALPGFRAKLLNFWVADHTRWLREAGIGREHIFSHQIPGESYGIGRLSRGASLTQTADTPSGSIGITTYFGAASDTKVFEKIVARNRNWGIFEYHPHPIDSLKAPVSEYLHSLGTCVRFRSHILTPITWADDSPEKVGGNVKDFIVSHGPFAEAIKQTLASLPDQPYFNKSYVDYAPPAVSGLVSKPEGDKTRLNWSPKIWADLRFEWPQWQEFDHFEVRSAVGRKLAETREFSALVDSVPGLKVVAVKKAMPPQIAAPQNVTASRGRLKWDELFHFFNDHYYVEIFAAPTAKTPLQTATTREANFLLRPIGAAREVWCRVATSDGHDRPGAFSPLVKVTLPRPGRRVADFAVLPGKMTDSPDARPREMSIGGETRDGLFLHPPLVGDGWARMAFRVKLPKVTAGQKLIFTTAAGIGESGAKGNGVKFRFMVGGQPKAELLVAQDGKWHEIEADLTALAGQEIETALETNSNGGSAGDWALWADPQIVLTGPGVRDLPQVSSVLALGKENNGRVTLKWTDRATDGTLWSKTAGFKTFRIYRGATRDFAIAPPAKIGESAAPEFVDERFDGTQTFYVVTAVFADGSESPPSEAVQYAP